MASAQLTKFPAEKRAALDARLKKMPKSGQQGVVWGELMNLTQGTLVYADSKNWIGHANFLPAIKAGDVTEITGKVPCKAGVVHSGLNQEGVECKWLLAFSALGVDKPGKVYVQDGQFDIDWKAIEMQLDESSELNYYEDPATGCTADAKIALDSSNAYVTITFGDESN